ncbi:MAG: signal peptide peptidase SppA [Bdellovibrionaceae bacterium]|nr:signal peptide peptidase SppA [Pseudobdellovibrionaceae bacterium]
MASQSWFRFLVLIFVFIGLAALLRVGGQGFAARERGPALVPKNAILHMEMEGVIMNGKRFLETLDDYAEQDNVKAILIDINSPGGAVGPSQEINSALLKIRETRKIPIVCTSSGLIASGAYYAAVACDKIVVAPGALVGSIGVIMDFANLGRLYDWAKIERYTITSGRYKDSGSEYRPMRDDEKKLFQDMIDEVYQQFKTTVAQGRPNLKRDTLDTYTDGRVFTGAKAVELGFADETGTFKDAIDRTVELAHLGSDYELFKAPRPRRSWWSFAGDEDSDPINGLKNAVKGLFQLNAVNRPMYVMPGTWE